MTDEPPYDPEESPIAHLIRTRPEAFDYDDVPDITDLSPRMRADLLKNAPPWLRYAKREDPEC